MAKLEKLYMLFENNQHPFLSDNKWENGHCPTYALGLFQALFLLNLNPQIYVGYRTCTPEVDPSSGLPSAQPYTLPSHVVVKCEGETFDYSGGDAIARWEDKFFEAFRYEARLAELADEPLNITHEFNWKLIEYENLEHLCSEFGAKLCIADADKLTALFLESIGEPILKKVSNM